MKISRYAGVFAGMLVASVFAVAPTTTANAKTKLATNPYVLRHHKYWYSRQYSSGHYTYHRLHFTRHAVQLAWKSRLKGQWHHSQIKAKYYSIVKRQHGYYCFGTRNSDDTTYVKPQWKNFGGKRHWTLGNFDVSNGNGGYQMSAPYTVWIYTTYLTHNAWYTTTSTTPF